MRKVVIKCGVGCLFLSPVLNSQTKWKVDPTHSTMGFSVKHMVITDVEGKFDKYDLNVTASKDDFSDAKVELSIDVNSINTGVEKRDAHLKGEDFFDAKNHPTITFKSKKVQKVGNNKYKLTGDLTIRGTTKEVTLDVEYYGTVKDPWGNTRAGFLVTGEINRFDFGLKWNTTLETGGLVVGEKVKIRCPVELIKQ